MSVKRLGLEATGKNRLIFQKIAEISNEAKDLSNKLINKLSQSQNKIIGNFPAIIKILDPPTSQAIE